MTVRERLLPGLVGRGAPLTLLVAPAGYGKTTLLAQAAAAFTGTVLRWHPSRDTRGAPALLGLLGRRLGLPEAAGAPEAVTVESVLLAVERWGEPVLLVVDDVHLVHGDPAESVLEELALLAPAHLRLILAGRRMPALNLTRAELSATTVLTARDLRLDAAEIAAAFPEAVPDGGPGGAPTRAPETAGRDRLPGGAAGGLPEPAARGGDLPAGHPTGPAGGRAEGAAAGYGGPGAVVSAGPAASAGAVAELTGGWPAVLRLGAPRLRAGRDPLDSPALRTYLDREVLAALPPGHPLEGPEAFEEYGMVAVPLLRAHAARAGRAARSAERCAPRPPAGLSVRCFRRYEATLGGRPLEWSATRPRVRALARLLSVHAGRPVHREELMAALWPESPERTAGRGLQVAVSALRTFLEPGTDRGRAQVLVRQGEAYMLVLGGAGGSDVQQFEAAVGEGVRAAARGEAGRAVEELGRALRLYTGELLPEDGPAEWVVPLRERYRAQAVRAAHALAEVELARGHAEAAVAAAGHALAVDPFQDAVWRLLIAAHRQAGDPAAARHAERRHARILASLGVLDPA